jgi:CHAT domain-containing protein/Tfp pilus assembly protein PilF
MNIKDNMAWNLFGKLTWTFAASAVLVTTQVHCIIPALASEAKEKKERNAKPDIERMMEQASMLATQGRYRDAATAWSQIIAFAELNFGINNPVVARSLNELAWLYEAEGRYDEAEPLYTRALAFFENSLEVNREHVAATLINLGLLYKKQGIYHKAESHYNRAVSILEKLRGANHPDVATGLGNLGALYKEQGLYEKAEWNIEKALAIREQALGPNHPDVAASLNSLSLLYVQQGRFSKAGPLLQRSLTIWEKSVGPEHPNVATSLNNLGGLYARQGDFDKAEDILLRALVLREKILGPDHLETASTLDLLGGIYMDQGNYSKAEKFVLRSLVVREKRLGPSHPDVAYSLNNLAVVHSKQGNHELAESRSLQALILTEKHLGSSHPTLGSILDNLSGIYRDQGRYIEAEAVAIRAQTIREQILGSGHPDVAIGLGNLALLYHRMGRYEKSINVLRRALVIQLAWLTRELPLIANSSRSAQLRKLGNTWELPFWMMSLSPSAVDLALFTRLNRQGLLQEIAKSQALWIDAANVDRDKLKELQALTQQLTSVSAAPDRQAVAREKRDRLQADLYRQQPDLQLQPVTTDEVAKSLPADGVLVEFQRFRPYDGSKPYRQRWGQAEYVALILRPNGAVDAVPLGASAIIDAAVQKGLSASAENYDDADKVWLELSNRVFKPLLPKLSGSLQWFLSPDGELNRVPFTALPVPDKPGMLLGEAVHLRLLTTGRELIRLKQVARSGSAALVMANPSYDHQSKNGQPTVSQSKSLLGQSRSADLARTRWRPLPASEQEGKRVATLLNARLLSGSAATTKALQRQQGPRVLHVATHGFFIADQEITTSNPLGDAQETANQLKELRGDDPQLRSGVVLAGANQPDADPNDDGYLTAAEAVMLNLKGTELVVLSACSTGQGDIRTGEGVYGLQRALSVAGARSTLLSLWKVDDTATAAFMESFYSRLKAGVGRSDALAATQAEFRKHPIPAWRNPYYWAAWQLVGDWRPIGKL